VDISKIKTLQQFLALGLSIYCLGSGGPRAPGRLLQLIDLTGINVCLTFCELLAMLGSRFKHPGRTATANCLRKWAR
jgi:hypothetical protein